MLYYAHKEERKFHLLSNHLARVAAGAAARLHSFPRALELIPAGVLTGLAHDFGKYTSYFQNYLRYGRGGQNRQHAFISGIWAAYLATWAGFPVPVRLLVFLAVIRHHQGLASPEEFLIPARDLSLSSWEMLEPAAASRLQVLKEQVEDIHEQEGRIARSLVWVARRAGIFLERQGLAVPDWLGLNWLQVLQDFLKNWSAAYGELYVHWRRLRRKATGNLEMYFDMLSIFSALIDADKMHAARVEEEKRAVIPAEGWLVEKYRAVCFGAPETLLEELREKIFQNVAARIKAAPLKQRIFTITAPTGTGKTLAGLQAAFCLRGRLAGQGGIPPRIIYALPFTSIVDQVHCVGEDVMKSALTSPEAAVPSSWLLKHHHLAEISYDSEGSGRSLDEALMLIESWQSEMVVTTFVQLFHTLIGYENRMLKKFCRLGGAVLVLDEVQNIPVEYWPLVEETLRRACELLDLRIIFMTATRPEWFGEGEFWELAGEPGEIRRHFQSVNRVVVSADINPKTVELAAAEFLSCYHPDRSYLVVLNTIKSSIAFFEALRKEWGGNGPSLYYLSTNIVPAERECRLREIRKLLGRKKKPVLVSTQVVEAGVDLDFDEVWRDLGPVDSVVQVAGRCNRNFYQPQGNVRLMHLVEQAGQDNRSLASHVYGKIHTLAARQLFATRPLLEEPDFFEAVGDYYRSVRESKSAAESEGLLKAMAELQFSGGPAGVEGHAVSDFGLIKELPNYVQVFVCTEPAAEDVWNYYQTSVAGERDMKHRRKAFLVIKKDFFRYLISVPANLLLHRLADESRPFVIRLPFLNEFYDPDTGFKRIVDGSALIY